MVGEEFHVPLYRVQPPTEWKLIAAKPLACEPTALAVGGERLAPPNRHTLRATTSASTILIDSAW
eukprot:5366111-Pyramimonas_sp.AAC.1